jgi:hypothetical protein
MRGILENIQILIPIALIIAFRIIRARNKAGKKQQKPAKGIGDFIKKIQDAQKNQETKHVSGRPAARTTAVKKPNKPLPKKQPHHSGYKPIFPEAAESIGQPKISSENIAKIEVSADDNARVSSIAPASGFSLKDLPSLQQAVLWSEILGEPKGMSI